jgi:hypothetical protein
MIKIKQWIIKNRQLTDFIIISSKAFFALKIQSSLRGCEFDSRLRHHEHKKGHKFCVPFAYHHAPIYIYRQFVEKCLLFILSVCPLFY